MNKFVNFTSAGIAIIIALQIFILTVIFGMKGRMGYMEAQDNHILNLLRARRIHIAQEEITRPFEVALITIKPFKISKENWMSGLHVIDAKNQQRISFEVPLDGSDDKELINLITGIAFRLDEYSLSFGKLKDFSLEIGNPIALPTRLDEKSSFLLYRVPDGFTTEFDIIRGTPKIDSLPRKIETWDDLIKEIKANIDTYIIKQPIKKK